MAIKIRAFAILIVSVLLAWACIGAEAQVTFSRDWGAGKRTIENRDFQNAMKTASSVCHLLLSQVRQLATCDDMDPGTSPVFGGRR